MMKKYLFLGLIASLSLVSYSQSKINPSGVLRIESSRIEGERQVSLLNASAQPTPTTGAFVTLSEGRTADDLMAEGYEVVTTIGDIAIVNLPINRVYQLADLGFVEKITLDEPARPMMNLARAATGVDLIQQGTYPDAKQSYTGSNVIVGLYDTGLDPNHINFRDRVLAVHSVSNTTGRLTTYTTPAEIAKFTTDSRDQTHGTHVAGIMAGSYEGLGTYAYTNANSKVVVTDGDIPYFGVAPEAELSIGCGPLTTSAIATGIQAVVKTMKESGKPGVANLSLGSNYGPHDGTDDFSRVLATLSKDAIICVSAGNEGDENISVVKKFSVISNKLNTFVSPVASSGSLPNAYSFNSQAEFWGDTDAEFTFDLVLYDMTDRKAAYTLSVPNLKGSSKTLSAEDTAVFAKAFSGDSYIIVTSGVNPSNNRYYVLFQTHTNRIASSDKNIQIAVNIKGKTNQVVNGYIGSLSGTTANIIPEFTDNGVSGYMAGTPDNSINNLACSPDVIAVGAYATRNNYPQLSGTFGQGWGMKVGEIAPFSSWGTTVDGRHLPVVCAPGTSIIASISSYYTGKSYNNCSAYVEEDSRSNYWKALSGTSMSSPFMAGVIALWLDANPALTTADVLDIIKLSSVKDEYTAVRPDRWGAGKVDAVAGLREAIALAGVEGIWADNDKSLVVSTNGSAFDVFVGGAKGFDVRLFNISGCEVGHTRTHDDTATIDASHLGAGIYVLSVECGGKRTTRKVVVK